MDKQFDKEEAIRLINGDFGKQLINMAINSIAPLYWYDCRDKGDIKIKSGTIFFLDTGIRKFAVTAYHVYQAYFEALSDNLNIRCQIEKILFQPDKHIIDYCSHLDIITFDIQYNEVQEIKKQFFTGHQSVWPPKPPDLEKGVFFSGYPGREKILLPYNIISWGVVRAFCTAKSVNENNIAIQLDYKNIVENFTTMPRCYDLRGVSGAPLITLVQDHIVYWRLGGVIYEAKEDLGLIFARPANYILADGMIRKN